MSSKNNDWLKRHKELRASLTKPLVKRLALEWNVTPAILHTLGAGWFECRQAYSFPERDHRGRIVGILLRDGQSGAKRTMKGSQRGLYFVKSWKELPGPLLIPEGVSDTAVLLAHGLAAIGRPSCKGGIDVLAELLRELDEKKQIIVVGENDGKPDQRWPGRDGAKVVAERLSKLLDHEVHWSLPPSDYKDVRDCLSTGGVGHD